MTAPFGNLPQSQQISYVMDGDAPAVVITLPHARARVSLVGAHVMSFETRMDGSWREHLWMSPIARPTIGKAVRGGIPLCWPWFGPHPTNPSLPQHGLARTALWEHFNATQQSDQDGIGQIVTWKLPDDIIASVPGLSSGAATVLFSVLVHDAGRLGVQMTVDTAVDFAFSHAFHTYFRVNDVTTIAVDGLRGGKYRDQADANRWKVLNGAFDFTREVNAHFPEQSGAQVIRDTHGRRRIDITTQGAKGTTVWHPGPDAPTKFAEIPAEVARHFVCVESGNLPENPVRLRAGERHEVSAHYRFSAL